MAGRQGFEPRFHGPEPRVLPLNDLPATVAARRNLQVYTPRATQATDASTVRPDLRSAPRSATLGFLGLDYFGYDTFPESNFVIATLAARLSFG